MENFFVRFSVSAAYTFVHVYDKELDFYTDASKKEGNGFGCFFRNEWCVGKWDPLFLKDEPSIALLELYPILMGLFVWKTNLQNSHCF